MRTKGLEVKEVKPKTKHRAGKGICNYKMIPSLSSTFTPNSVRVKGRQVISTAVFPWVAAKATNPAIRGLTSFVNAIY